MTDVFISYKKEDLPRIEPIARALANAGYEVWWDHRIPAGRSYREVIGAALQTAKCVIVVWSNLSAGAQWVLDEADEGKKRGVLLPLLIDVVEIPYGFRQIEAASLIGWTGDVTDPEWQNALSAVAHFVGRAPGSEPPKPFVAPHAPKVAAPAPAKPKSKAAPLIGGLIAGVVVVGGVIAAYQNGLFDDRSVHAEPGDGSVVDGQDGQVVATPAAPVEQAEPPATAPPAQPAETTGEKKPTEFIEMKMKPSAEILSRIITATPGAPRCAPGYVWRETKADDYVCVTPDSRARVRQENAMAASRVDPNGGPYGPATCLSGYVWREAFNGDTVCVSPEIRGLVADENRLSPSRTAQP